MNKYKVFSKLWFLVLLLVTFVAGCASNGPEIPLITGTTPTTSTDTVRPMVTFKSPDNNATAVPTNTKVYVGFSKVMDPATINTDTFMLKDSAGIKVNGLIEKFGASATFAPTSELTPGATYTATVTTGAKDLTPSGNALLSPSEWEFTIGAGPDSTLPTVTFKFPADGATDVPDNTKVYVGFSKVMDPATINTDTFMLKDSDGIKVGGLIEKFGATATFTPTVALTPGATYTATVTTGAKDLTLAGNALATPSNWSFTIAAAGIVIVTDFGPAGSVNLKSVAPFGIIAYDAITNSVSPSHIYGDVALTQPTGVIASVSDPAHGFNDGGLAPMLTSTAVTNSNGTFPGLVTATDNGTVTARAALPQLLTDLKDVYIDLDARPATSSSALVFPNGVGGGTFAIATDLSGWVLTPGVYRSTSSYGLSSVKGPLVLDAQGKPDAVFIIQSSNAVTGITSTNGSVVLQNGAQAKNVFWVVLDATIGTTTFFQGTVVAGNTITLNTFANVEGRMLAGARGLASGAIVLSGTNVITVPQ